MYMLSTGPPPIIPLISDRSFHLSIESGATRRDCKRNFNQNGDHLAMPRILQVSQRDRFHSLLQALSFSYAVVSIERVYHRNLVLRRTPRQALEVSSRYQTLFIVSSVWHLFFILLSNYSIGFGKRSQTVKCKGRCTFPVSANR